MKPLNKSTGARLINNIERCGVFLDRWADRCSICLVGLFTALVLVAVVFRYVFIAPIFWSEELARTLLVYMAFFAASVALRRGEHVGFDLMVALIRSQRLSAMVLFSQHFVIFWFALILVIHGARLAYRTLEQTTPALGIPMTWFYLSIPIGSALIVLQAAVLMFRFVYTILTRLDKNGKDGK
jgi:TRAP-type C4-dicarboxylate transport system permease small subunit